MMHARTSTAHHQYVQSRGSDAALSLSASTGAAGSRSVGSTNATVPPILHGSARRSLYRSSVMSTPGSFTYRGVLSVVPVRALASIVAVLMVAACGSPKGADGADTTTDGGTLLLGREDIAVAEEAEIGISIPLSGPLSPRDRAVLRAQVPGTIADQRVDNGSRVQAGQRLLTIRALGVVSQAEGAKAAVAAAEAGVAVARKQLDAATSLFAAGAMSAIERQSAEAGFEAAQAQLAAARAQAAGAEEAATRTVVVAPFAGIISNRRRQNDEPVGVNDELLTVVDSRVLELSGQIGVTDAVRVRPGQTVAFALDAFPGENFSGRVVRMDPVADAGTRQVGVYVELANAGGRIVGGQYARGSIDLGSSKHIVVPATAVVDAGADGSGGSVFVIVDGRLTRRAVVVGARDDATGMIAVMSGVSAGEQVLRTPSVGLREGTAARILGADDASATPAATGEADSAVARN